MILRSVIFLLLFTVQGWAQSVSPASHPLDALTADEIAQSVQILKAAGVTEADTLFPTITLHPPPKDQVSAWTTGQPFPRLATVVTFEKGKTVQYQLDLKAGKILSTTPLPQAQPMIMDVEWNRARDAFMADPRLKAALQRRGYAEKNSVFCTPNSAGFFPSENFSGRRVLRIPCFDGRDRLHPSLARPVEGLMGIVDSDTGEVLVVHDSEVVPLHPAPDTYGKSWPPADAPLKPLRVAAPEGSNITITGNSNIAWGHWSLHVRGDKRAGLILSLVRFQDGNRQRLIAYDMNMSEIFVPYMDPNPTWNYRTFMDAGEFGLGYLISSLEPGIDCPDGAMLLDLTLPDDVGGSYVKPRAACVFERLTGDPAWRHYSASSKKTLGRAETELVVRHIPTLGNYDYIVDYVFSPRGSIKVRVGATGYDAIKSTEAADMSSPTAAKDTEYGTLIAPYTIAPNHDHYFNFRLDLDIDGAKNTLVRDQFVPEVLRDSPTRKSLWRVRSKLVATEGPIGQPHTVGGVDGGEAFRLANMNEQNALKQNPSYWLHVGHSDSSILSADDPPQQRAAFSGHALWISKYNPDELYAAGPFPNLSRGGEGLPGFVKDGASILNSDVVLWYNIGFRHAPKPEDFPILPTMWHEFVLRPAFFFDRDPSSALGLPAAPQ